MPHSMANRFVVIGTVFFVLSSLFFVACGDDDNDSLTDPPIETVHVTFPLKVGHVWNFDHQLIEGLAPAEPYALEITDTREIEGQTYFTLVDVDDDSPSAIYLRQSGNKLWVIPQEFFDGELEEGNAISQWIQEQSAATFPWLYADTDAAANVPWTIFEAAGTITLEGFEVDLSVQITGTHLGAGESIVPAGTFTTTRTRIDQQVRLVAPVGNFSIDNSQEFEIADEVGLVRIHEVTTDPVADDNETEESKLTSYTLAK